MAEALTALAGQTAFEEKYGARGKSVLLFAVGDGNHSLATAKACYERQKELVGPEQAACLPARYALVELVNLHDESLQFEPIHRVVFDTNPKTLLADLLAAYEGADEVYAITITGTLSGSYNAAQLAAEEYQQENPGKRVFVLDSLSTGPEQRLLAEHLRDLLAEGKEFDEICEEMLRYHKHTHLLFSLESLANLARNGRVKPAVAAVARMLGIRVIGQASEAGELDVLCKTRGEHGALERIVLELKEHGYTNGRLHISHCGNPAAAERLKHMVKAVFDGAKVDISECGGLCSYYAELGGLLVGYEDAEA